MNSDLRNTLICSNNIIIEREKQKEETINQLAIDVQDISDFFSDLLILVNYQGITIDNIETNIETNIENSLNNIGRANKQLLKTNRYQIAKYRYLYRCIFFLFIILLILIIIL